MWASHNNAQQPEENKGNTKQSYKNDWSPIRNNVATLWYMTILPSDISDES